MATLLFRLGRFAYRRALLVITAWLIATAAALGGGLLLGGTLQDSYEIPGTESQEAIDLLAAVFPQTAGASAQIVVHDPDGGVIETTVSDQIETLVDELNDIDGVEQAVSPFSEFANEAISDDGDTVLVQVQFSGSMEEIAGSTLDDLRAATEALQDDGFQVAYGGNVFESFSFGLTIIELVGVAFAALVLIVTFGSFVAAGLPLLSAFLGLGVSLGGVLVVAGFTTISTTTPMLALMIGLAVGIDYALFILNRHRQQLATGMDAEESAATSVATAGGSVVFAAITVVIALAGLLVVGIPFLGTMGVAAAGSVVTAMLAALTLLPALMGLLKHRLAPRASSRAAARARAELAESAGEAVPAHKPTLGERWVGLVVKAPIVAILAVVGVLGTLAIPAFSLQLALPSGATQAEGTDTRESYDLIAAEFGEGQNGPLIVTVDITQTTEIFEQLEAISDEIAELDGVASASDGVPNETLDTGIIQVVPETGPADAETTALVQEIRALAPELEERYDTEISVTGTTAVQIDISQRLDSALLPFGIIVVGLSIVLLTAVFRSILVPIKAALGYLLSLLAGMGASVAVFQWGWGAELLHAEAGPILSFMPVLLMAILFGLAMDYELFLVSGMRESYVHQTVGKTLSAREENRIARDSVVRGFAGAARVVTAAALIMFFVFAAFVPEGSDVIKVIALGLAVGIAADAFLIRMTLVPAVMALAGRWAWKIPRWLDRILPDLDVEGAGLAQHREASEWAHERLAAGDAVTLDALTLGTEREAVGPFRLAVPLGAIALLDTDRVDAAERRLLAATIAGRIPPLAGRAQVLGHPLPSESSRAARRVALGDLDGPGRAGVGAELGVLLAERIRVTGSLARSVRAHQITAARIARLNATLRELGLRGDLTASTALAELPQLDRALALATVALAEDTPLVILDAVSAFGDPEDAAVFIRGLDRLAPATTTVIVGVPGLAVAPSAARRMITTVSVAAIEGVAR
ncbi:MMPL family transporter [uncultured Schumannella sp.]|uniref:MMPL family transporter n=1 Tax=uncultured Schumannella sp. TaxID=1195956 RepID=UPI0025CFB2A7|nr:MMPL family transporter [uncultured Schumannella sp.]